MRLPSTVFYKSQRRGVHAVAQISRFWPIVEDMSKMRIAFGAGDFSPSHAKTGVVAGANVLLRDGRPKARPTGPQSNLVSELNRALLQQMQR